MSQDNRESMPFTKEKLSPIALDHFVEKHNVNINNNGFPYITQDGRELFFSPLDVIIKRDRAHFEYLLGQTTPYRHVFSVYPLQDIAYLNTGDKRSTLVWTTDPKVLRQFVELITSLGYGKVIMGEKGPSIDIDRVVKPVIHIELEDQEGVEQSDIFLLTDENGDEIKFEFFDSMQYNGKKYIALLSCKDEMEEVEMAIFEELDNEDGSFLNVVEDEDVYNSLFCIFMERNSDEA